MTNGRKSNVVAQDLSVKRGIMSFIRWFKETSKDDVAIVGGKAANLGEMYNAGFPVPPGFTITAQCYKYFIEKTRIKDKIFSILKNININDTDKLQEYANEIQKLIISTEVPLDIREEIIDNYEALEIPDIKKVKHVLELANIKEYPFVAVRSSATAEDLPEASFAGAQATYLNVKGVEQLIKAVRACWHHYLLQEQYITGLKIILIILKFLLQLLCRKWLILRKLV